MNTLKLYTIFTFCFSFWETKLPHLYLGNTAMGDRSRMCAWAAFPWRTGWESDWRPVDCESSKNKSKRT